MGTSLKPFVDEMQQNPSTEHFNKIIKKIGDELPKRIKYFITVVQFYVTHASKISNLYVKCCEHQLFADAMDKFNTAQEGRGSGEGKVQTELSKPVTRYPKYALILKSLLKTIPNNTQAYTDLMQTIQQVDHTLATGKVGFTVVPPQGQEQDWLDELRKNFMIPVPVLGL